MQVTTPSLPGLTLQPLTAARPMVEAWSVGQLLQATVVAPVQPHRVTLLIGGSRMEAETNSPLRPGQQLSLRVEQRGETTLLRVLPQKSEPQAIQTRALRAALPRQTPLPPLLANLAQLAKAPEQIPHEAAPAWAKLARAVVRALPEQQALTNPAGLRRAMNDSGTFFESRAARAARGDAPFPAQDFKASLLRLAALFSRATALPSPARPTAGNPPPSTAAAASMVLGSPPTPSGSAVQGPVSDAAKPAALQAEGAPSRADTRVQDPGPPPRRGPPQPQHPATASIASLGSPGKIATELRGQVEGAISRVQLHQLNSLSGEEGAKPVWSMEIPVRRGEQMDVWSLRIEEDSSGPPEAPAKRWCISLAFELEALGPVHARLTLQSQKVSASLWAERESTAALIGRHAEELRRMFDGAGLGVGDILCVHGQPPQAPAESSQSSLISVEA